MGIFARFKIVIKINTAFHLFSFFFFLFLSFFLTYKPVTMNGLNIYETELPSLMCMVLCEFDQHCWYFQSYRTTAVPSGLGFNLFSSAWHYYKYLIYLNILYLTLYAVIPISAVKQFLSVLITAQVH